MSARFLVTILVIISTILTSSISWESFSPTKAYVYINDCKDYTDAKTHCVQLGGQLASAHLLEQRTFIVNMIQAPTGSCLSWPRGGYGIWLGGLHNGTSSSNFDTTSVEWFDGTVTPFKDMDWDAGDPENEPDFYQGEHHLGIGLRYPNLKFHTTYLGDSGCAYVCQKIIETPSPTETTTTAVPTTHHPTTFTPTALPTKVPTTPNPTRYPTVNPTMNTIPPTANTMNPTVYTANPTMNTIPPTMVLSCNEDVIESYNGESLTFHITMPFKGELIFDATTNFPIAGIEAFDASHELLGTAAGSNEHKTVSIDASIGAYTFVVIGNTQKSAIYHVKIICIPDITSTDNDPSNTEFGSKKETDKKANKSLTFYITFGVIICLFGCICFFFIKNCIAYKPQKPKQQKQLQMEDENDLRMAEADACGKKMKIVRLPKDHPMGEVSLSLPSELMSRFDHAFNPTLTLRPSQEEDKKQTKSDSEGDDSLEEIYVDEDEKESDKNESPPPLSSANVETAKKPDKIELKWWQTPNTPKSSHSTEDDDEESESDEFQDQTYSDSNVDDGKNTKRKVRKKSVSI
eukprot:1108489_1